MATQSDNPTTHGANDLMRSFIVDSPCDHLVGRLRDICTGDAAGISRATRNAYLDLWLYDGTLHADPRTVQHEPSSVPRKERERTEAASGSRYDPNAPCRHLGEVVRIEQCKLCGGKSRPAEVRTCSLKGECTLNEFKLKLPICFKCREYEP